MLTDLIDTSEDLFFSLVNPVYLSPVTQSEIQAKFETSSEICLPDFLNREVFAAAALELESANGWQLTGPPNRYRYTSLKGQCHEIFRCLFFS